METNNLSGSNGLLNEVAVVFFCFVSVVVVMGSRRGSSVFAFYARRTNFFGNVATKFDNLSQSPLLFGGHNDRDPRELQNPQELGHISKQ